jgi:hypothetical protein
MQGAEVVWLTELISNILDIDDAIVAIKHEGHSCELPPLASATTVGLLERCAAFSDLADLLIVYPKEGWFVMGPQSQFA